jgi:hypothetical protein
MCLRVSYKKKNMRKNNPHQNVTDPNTATRFWFFAVSGFLIYIDRIGIA